MQPSLAFRLINTSCYIDREGQLRRPPRPLQTSSRASETPSSHFKRMTQKGTKYTRGRVEFISSPARLNGFRIDVTTHPIQQKSYTSTNIPCASICLQLPQRLQPQAPFVCYGVFTGSLAQTTCMMLQSITGNKRTV